MAITLTANFDIYNEETVKRLQEEDPDILPTYNVDKQKDLAYNKKQVTAAITSAVIQGKSIDKIADDLQTRMTSINRSGAIKTARTAITSAQNGGTLASMKELAAMGIEVQKEWVATLDDRTRPTHRALDGQRRDLDKAFSNGLQYPGDSRGSAGEVWNCRCTIISYIPEYDSNDEPRVTYSEWEEYKQKTGNKSTKINVKDYKNIKDEITNKGIISGRYNTGTDSYEDYTYNPDTGILKVDQYMGNTTIAIFEADISTGEIKYIDRNGNIISVSKDMQGTIRRYLKRYGIDINIDMELRLDGVDSLKVKKLTNGLTVEDIIKRVGGGDLTSGSCSSLALTYIGNRAGYDVLDFRGGMSETWFSSYSNIERIANLDGVSSVIIEEYNGFTATNKALKTMQVGKEYYLATGGHAAVVRRTTSGFEYLELQCAYSEYNGYQKLTNSELKNRFGCQKSRTWRGNRLKQTSILIDAETLEQSEEFKQVLEYINTEPDKQKKGSGGYAK